MKKITIALTMLVFSLAAYNVNARMYIGGGTGEAEFDFSGVEEGDSEKYYIGFQPAGKLYGFEIASLDSGKADINGGGSIQVEGYNFSAIYNTTPGLGFRQRSNMFFKLGYYLVETKYNDSVVSTNEDSNGFSFGLGIDYAINDALSLRADFEGLYDVEDFEDNGILTFLTLGAQINF